MENFQSVAAGIFEEDGVVTALVLHRPFHVARASLPGDFCQLVHLARLSAQKAIRFSFAT
jgi:hypothetical protein